MNDVTVDLIVFDETISQQEIPFFRGAIIASAGPDADILFHDHKAEGVLYDYPKIQYKKLNGQAAIVCVNEGTELAEQLLSPKSRCLKIGYRESVFNIASFSETTVPIQSIDGFASYRIEKWLALNQENHSLYMSMLGLADKYSFLERILTANILSFAKGVGSVIDEELVVKITDFGRSNYYNFKKIKMLGFDLTFSTNIILPDLIGLGKGVSLGFGTIKRL